MRHQIAHGKCVAHHKALELPCVAQHSSQQKAVARRRHAVQIHVGAHHRRRARLHRRMERRQIHIPQLLVRDIRGIVIAPSVGRAVTGEVLHRCQHMPRFARERPLKSLDLCLRHRRSQKRVFAGAFHNAAPAWIARNIHHRRKTPAHARRTRLARRHGLRPLHHGRVPGCRHRQRNREHRLESVNYIQAE